MKIEYREIDYSNDFDCELLAKWANDKEINYLFLRFSSEQEYQSYVVSKEDFKKKANIPSLERENEHLFILVDQVPIGFIEFEIDSAHKKSINNKSAWLDIVIGEKEMRGHGIGKVAMKYLESLAIKHGAKEAELGVFEYNELACSMYKKMGYQEFHRVQQIAYWDGKYWDDIRLIKIFEK